MSNADAVLLEKARLLSEDAGGVKNLFIFSKEQENDFSFEVGDIFFR